MPVRFAFVLRPAMSRAVSGRPFANAPPWRMGRPPLQGSSLRSGLFCPGPSSLMRPHPPHSQAHRDVAAWWLIRNAFAVRERDPRVVPGFSLTIPRLPAVWSPVPPPDMTTTWTGLLVLAGLSPAGMAASLAAPEPYGPDSGIRLPP